jgi:hypothetical protein
VYGFCKCGCGEPTSVPARNNARRGEISGVPRAYVKGHHGRDPQHPSYRGLRHINKDGYVELRMPSHPRAKPNGYVLEHIAVVEAALGHCLPNGAVVHHINENPSDNRNSNLIVCPDRKYHRLLHMRAKALRACGHVDWIHCLICGKWGLRETMYSVGGTSGRHTVCHARAERLRRRGVTNGK